MHTTVRRFATARCDSRCTSVAAESESRPVVGSSRKSTAASVTRPIPTDTLRRSPPEMPELAPSMSWPIRECLTACSSSSVRICSTRRCLAWRGIPWGSFRRAEVIRASETVAHGSKTSDCQTTEDLRLKSAGSISLPVVVLG